MKNKNLVAIAAMNVPSKNVLTTTVLMTALVLAMATPMFAQHAGPMKVTVPFNFVVENERMQAGDYTIEKIANGRLKIYTNDGRVSATFIALPSQAKTSDQAHFIFNRYGNDYFLDKISTPGQSLGWEVMHGKLETELAKKKTFPVETATLIGH